MNIFQFISNKFERDEKILIMIVISSLFIIFIIAMVREQSELHKKEQAKEIEDNIEIISDELAVDPSMELSVLPQELQFKCPKDYESPEDYIKDLDAFLENFNTDATLEDIGKARMKFLRDNDCEETLNYMTKGNKQEKIKIENIQFSGQMDVQKISPDDKIIQFLGKNFGPYTTDINKHTKVRNAYYPIGGQETGNAEVEIIFNFYLQNIYLSEPFSSQSLAYEIRENADMNVISFFEAPDPINKKQAFYFVADYISAKNGYGYAYITKMASIGEDVYTVGLSKLFLGQTKEEIQGLIDNWLLNNMKICGEAIGNIGVEESWLEFFDETNFE